MTVIWKRLPGRRGIPVFWPALCILSWTLATWAAPGSRAVEPGHVTHSFVHTQTHYIFEGCFEARADLDCLLHIFYDYDHFKALMSHVEDIRLDREGDAWYEVTYTYRNLFYEAVSTFRRTMDLKSGRVLDDLIRVRQKGMVAPAIHSIRGYFRLTPRGDGVRVTFHQEGEMDAALLGGFYFRFAEREAAAFMERVMIYAGKVCNEVPREPEPSAERR